MTSYSPKDIVRAFREAGIEAGDTIFLSCFLSSLGRLEGASSKEIFCASYLSSIFEVLGSSGTLVVPTYTQQVGRFGVPYIHETTPTPYGEFYELIRSRPGAVRSFHPVFSLTAMGAKAAQICGEVDASGFGVNSAFGYLFRSGGKSLSLGFELSSGNIVKGAHYVETTYGAPYTYNKILDADVYKKGQKSSKVFVLNVPYRNVGVEFDFSRYTQTLNERGLLRSAKLGEGILFACDLNEQLRVGYELLDEDVYAFLEKAPQFEHGKIPLEGCEERLSASEARNWTGMGIAGGWY